MKTFVPVSVFALAFCLLDSTSGLGQSAAAKARVATFVGAWGGYGSIGSSISGNVQFESRFIKTTVTATGPGGIEIKSEVQAMTCSLALGAGLDKYVLSFSAEGFPSFKGLPLTYSESGEFSGSLTYTVDGQPHTATATIKQKDGSPYWEIESTRGTDRWWMRFPLTKEK
jgi:hypothetical protein